MKIARLNNGVVIEIIPEEATPVEKWYGEHFAEQCREVPDYVLPNWGWDPEKEVFLPPNEYLKTVQKMKNVFLVGE